MLIQLIDRNEEMCNQWKLYFQDCKDVVVHHGDFFGQPTDCVVSPANSFGFMDGGLDYVISMKLGWHIQNKLQHEIYKSEMVELLVGQAILIETNVKEIPYLISAPTMRVPLIINETANVYLAAKAIFNLLKKEQNLDEPRINTVTISGLGTGVGKVPYEICALQMKQAYNDVWLKQYDMPSTWQDASIKHHHLFKKQA